MFGFHRRTRSLIPVKELAKYDALKVADDEEVEDVDCEMAMEAPRPEQTTQLTLIFIVFLAEAIVSSSIQPQLKMLVENENFCGDLSSSYLRSILDCAYAFGGTAGICWGYLADRIGRRPVVLGGLFGMSACCISMGFSTDLVGCAILRFVAGLVSSSVIVSVLTMIGDLSQSMAERARNVSMLPLLGICGSIGPLVQSMVADSVEAEGEIWQKYPILSSQIACGSLVFVIAVSACVTLQETLPTQPKQVLAESYDIDCEKAAFLGQVDIDPLGSPTITIVDAVRPEPISIGQFITAPSVFVLLSSFSILSLHASTFDVLLPHLGHSSTHHGGMGIPCSWLGVTVLAVRAVAGGLILRYVPGAIEKYGLLRLYRFCSMFFPAIYIITPALGLFAGCSMGVTAAVSAAAILIKHALAGGAQVLVALLMLNAAPDAFSAGSIVGLMQIASMFKALAVAVSGASFYLSTDYSIAMTNYTLWTSLALFGAIGAALAWFVRERPTVGRDLPAEVLCWETCFDAEGPGEL